MNLKFKGLLGIFLVFFLIGIISALDFDNVKTYDETEKLITINNAFNLPFIGTKLAEYKLTENTDQCLINCHAEGYVTLYTKGYLFTDMNFKDRIGSLKEIEHKILIEVTEEYTETLVDWEKTEKTCTISKDINKTTGELDNNCEWNYVYKNVTKIKYSWKEYKGEVLSEGTYKWRIEGKKKIDEVIDWIGTSFGEEFKEWAWWDSDWDYKKSFNITASSTNRINEPVWIYYENISDGNLANSPINAIRIVDATETKEIPFEVVDSNPFGNHTGANFVAGDKIVIAVNSTAGVQTQYYIYYGNTGASSGMTDFVYWYDTFDSDSTGNYSNYHTTVTYNATAQNVKLVSNAGSNSIWTPTSYSNNVSSSYKTFGTISGFTGYPNIGLGAWNSGLSRQTNQGDGYWFDVYPNGVTSRLTKSDTDTIAGAGGGSLSASYYGAYYDMIFSIEDNGASNENLSVYQNGSIQFSDSSNNDITPASGRPWVALSNPNGGNIDNFGSFAIWTNPRVSDNMKFASDTAEESGASLSVTLNSPANEYSSSTYNITFNCSSTDNAGVTSLKLIIDNVVNYTLTNSTAGQNLSMNYQVTNIPEGVHTWTCNATDGVEAEQTTGTRNFTVDTTPFIAFLTPPTYVNYFNTTNEYTPMAINTTTPYFRNITYFLQNANGSEYSQFYENATYDINFTDMPDGHYHYNVTICTTTGKCNTTETRHLNHDSTVPAITLSEFGNITYHITGNNLTLNWTTFDNNPGFCFISYGGINKTVSCSANTTQINVTSFDYRNLTFYANDTLGNTNSSFISWNYYIFQDGINYRPLVFEGSLEVFSLEMHSTFNIIGQKMNYDSDDYFSNKTTVSSNYYNITNNLQIPDFPTSSTAAFFYNITFSDGISAITNSYNQSVDISILDNCSSYNYTIFNFSLFDERLLTKITGNIETDLSFYNQDGSIQLNNLSVNFGDIQNGSVCSNLNLTGSGFYYNLEIRYSSPENGGYNYVPEFYHVQKGDSSNFPVLVNLYDLNINESTEFTLQYRDNDYTAREGVLLQILRKYVNEGIYRVVEIPITSNEGKAIAHLDLNNYKYKIIASLNGETLNVFDNPAVICESELSGICVITLNGKGNPDPFLSLDEEEGMAYSITQNNNTITVSYNIPSGETKEVRVEMVQISPLTTNQTICNSSIISSSGSFECDALSTIGDSEVLIKISWENYVRRARATIQEDLGDFFLLNNYVIAGLFLIMFITMFVSSPKIMVSVAVFSVAILGFLFLIKGSSIGLALGAISWLIISGILILIKINQKDET